MDFSDPDTVIGTKYSNIHKGFLPILALLAALGTAWPAAAAPVGDPWAWTRTTADGSEVVNLYFFWSERCPHCQEARPFIESLQLRHHWLRVYSYEVGGNRDNAARYQALARSLGREASSVPAFVFCGTLAAGWKSVATTGAWLERQLDSCRDRAATPGTETATAAFAAPPPPLEVPLLGMVDPGRLSLPTLTLVLAGLDSFNPCAFFVLLFLLSLMVHARSRGRMLMIGGVFVLCSGLVYFLFMSAWLKLFLLIGGLSWITLGAGVVAVGIGLLNIKEYFRFRHGPSLTIPEQAKPRLFERMRRLALARSLAAMLLGTVLLALAANSYELLCTAGFPLVYTRLLTLNELPVSGYYLYLLLYNLVYIIPLLVIVVLFTLTLGSRKLSEREGRLLKLLSGLMMAQLGGVLLLAPGALGNPLLALGLVATAFGLTLLAAWRERHVGLAGPGGRG